MFEPFCVLETGSELLSPAGVFEQAVKDSAIHAAVSSDIIFLIVVFLLPLSPFFGNGN